MFGRGRRARREEQTAPTSAQRAADAAGQQPAQSQWEFALSQLDDRAAADPLVYARVMGATQVDHAEKILAVDGSLDPVTAVTVLGSLAGLWAQMAVVRGIQTDPEHIGQYVTVVDTAGGDRALMGDAINVPMFESEHSIWEIMTSTVRRTGGPVPTIADIAGHGSRVLGTPAFAAPRFAPGTSSRIMPRDTLPLRTDGFWMEATEHLPERRYHWLFACAVATVLDRYADRPELESLTRVALDSANAMAKLIPATPVTA